ncbi:magnesium transporter NIPA-domain-containing protein [Dichomitus squalens]|uniref:Magnesium transporter NIPA-domain-containing protein n=1 Tax=Dichomitus squalens TaxID=114155 RepID=A0A4Q9PL51_9APHY|nr:magnesium transporter NIPA-domain-containing protein [Dichomitus squalens]
MSSDSSQPSQYRAVGVVLAIGSGVLIGSSFVFKKKGLLSSQKGHVMGEGVAYLKSPMWWTGMTIMILGELCNFVAYAFVEAIIVTPMGALSVVISSILSHFFLNERLSLFGWISSIQCLLGASILALNGPQEQSVSTIEGFKHLFLAPWFLAYGGVVLAVAVFLALWVAPRYGHRTMMPYLGVCSLIGGLSVSCTQGLGACIVTSIRGDNQFKNWFIYFLLVFVVVTLLTEIYYLNVALALFNTAMVTPTYYVTFTFCTLVTSVILYQGLKASASQIITIVLAFAVICTGIIILQMTKVDPRQLTNVDEHTTLLLEAAKQEADPLAAQEVELTRGGTLRSRRSRLSQRVRSRTPEQEAEPAAARSTDDLEAGPIADLDDEIDLIDEKRAIIVRTEEPGLDSLRMTGGAIGSIIRARRRATALSQASATRSRLSVSTNANSLHSQEVAHTGPRRSSLSPGPRPTWYQMLVGRKLERSRSPNGTHSNLPGVSENEKPETQEVSGLPNTLSDSPITVSIPTSPNGMSPSQSANGTHSARFLSNSELVTSPLLTTPTSEETARRPSVRFLSEGRTAVSAPDVRGQATGTLTRPTITVQGEDDAAATRSRTMPAVFTRAERARAEDVLRESPPPAS